MAVLYWADRWLVEDVVLACSLYPDDGSLTGFEWKSVITANAEVNVFITSFLFSFVLASVLSDCLPLESTELVRIVKEECARKLAFSDTAWAG